MNEILSSIYEISEQFIRSVTIAIVIIEAYRYAKKKIEEKIKQEEEKRYEKSLRGLAKVLVEHEASGILPQKEILHNLTSSIRTYSFTHSAEELKERLIQYKEDYKKDRLDEKAGVITLKRSKKGEYKLDEN